MRSLGKIWIVTGQLHREDGKGELARTASWDDRQVYVELPVFPTEDQAKEALMHNWSSQPYRARVTAIQAAELKLSLKLVGDDT